MLEQKAGRYKTRFELEQKETIKLKQLIAAMERKHEEEVVSYPPNGNLFREEYSRSK